MESIFRDVNRTTAGDVTKRNVDASFGDAYLHLWAYTGTSGACAFDDSDDLLQVFVLGTTPGLVPSAKQLGYQSEIGEIRRLSSLTWDQLAGIFGVNRRSLHFWARGARPSTDNALRIGGVLNIIRRLDTGDPSRTRDQLLQPRWEGLSVVNLLCERRDDDVLAFMSSTPKRPERARGVRRPPALPATERALRQGLSPTDLLDARHDGAPELGRPIGAIPIPGLRV